jgi:hypothetical protein
MKTRNLIAAGALAASLSLVGCASDNDHSPSSDTTHTAGLPSSDESQRQKAIVELHQAVDNAWNAGDAEAFAARWAEDGTVVSPLGQVSVGRAAIRTEEAAAFNGPMKGTRHTLPCLGFTGPSRTSPSSTAMR